VPFAESLSVASAPRTAFFTAIRSRLRWVRHRLLQEQLCGRCATSRRRTTVPTPLLGDVLAPAVELAEHFADALVPRPQTQRTYSGARVRASGLAFPADHGLANRDAHRV
jgi:hypothetical protein